jgi:hypothetical protein
MWRSHWELLTSSNGDLNNVSTDLGVPYRTGGLRADESRAAWNAVELIFSSLATTDLEFMMVNYMTILFVKQLLF